MEKKKPGVISELWRKFLVALKRRPQLIALTALMILVCAVVSAFFSGKGITKLEPVKILKEE